MLKSCNTPENDDLYSGCLTMRTDLIEDPDRIDRVFQGISQLDECDRIVLFDPYFTSIVDIRNNQEAMEKFNNKPSYRLYKTTDKEAPVFFGIEVEWFPKKVDHNECILVGETLYRNLTEIGLLSDNTMTISCAGPIHSLTLPIAGIIKNAPYEKDTDCIVAISKYWEEIYPQYTLIPKKGKGKTFAKSVENALIKYDPENLNNNFMLHNYRDYINETPSVVSAVYVGCVILAIVSLLICAMSIFSAVALDTRGRKKEIAIRKVNGAKNKDIYKVIGVQYLVVLGLSLVVAVPASVWLQHIIEPHFGRMLEIGNVSPIMPIVLGSLLVIVLVALIVFLQIRKILQIDTSKIIAKE